MVRDLMDQLSSNHFFFPETVNVIVPSLMEESYLSSEDITEEKPLTDSESESLNYNCDSWSRTYLQQNTVPASYPCLLCGRKFKRSDLMKGHMEKCRGKSGLH